MTLVCPDCFGDTGLQSRLVKIRPKFDDKKCDFHSTKKGIPIEAVAEIVDPIFRQHYQLGDFTNRYAEQNGDPLVFCVGEFTQAEEDSAEALAEALCQTESYYDPDVFYGEELNYVRDGTDVGSFAHSQLWAKFCRAITYSVRFFNNDAEQKLKEIFEGIQFQKDADQNPPVRRLSSSGAESQFWRARIANNLKDRQAIRERPALELGAPPMRLRRAGRMNSWGIKAFYAAFDLDTAISEIRPVVGDKLMAGKFELTRDVYVLDTTRFTAPIKEASLFNVSYEQRVNQWAFCPSSYKMRQI